MKKKPTNKQYQIIFEILMILTAVIFIFPVVVTVLNAFRSNSDIQMAPISLPGSLELSNFINAWVDMHFLKVLMNTSIITVISTLGIILITSMAAYIMVRSKFRYSFLFFMLFVFYMMVPFQTIMIPLVVMAKNLHLKNIWGIILIYIGVGSPLSVMLYHGFIQSVPVELEESAALDGASVFRTYFTIVMPLLTPITATVAVLNFLWIWNDFLLPLLILPKGTTIQLAIYQFFGAYRSEYGKASAALVLSSIPIVVFYLYMQKYIVKGISAGAVKG